MKRRVNDQYDNNSRELPRAEDSLDVKRYHQATCNGNDKKYNNIAHLIRAIVGTHRHNSYPVVTHIQVYNLSRIFDVRMILCSWLVVHTAE